MQISAVFACALSLVTNSDSSANSAAQLRTSSTAGSFRSTQLNSTHLLRRKLYAIYVTGNQQTSAVPLRCMHTSTGCQQGQELTGVMSAGQQSFALLAAGCKAGIVWLWRYSLPAQYAPVGYPSPNAFALVSSPSFHCSITIHMSAAELWSALPISLGSSLSPTWLLVTYGQLL